MADDNVAQNIYRHKRFVRWSGLFLEVAGVLFIFMDLQADGTITIKTPLIEGSINATYIGLFVIMMGMVLQAITILKEYAPRARHSAP